MRRPSVDNLVETFYPETSFGGFTNVDGTVAFYSRINALLRPDSVVLDFGCGRGEYAEDEIRFRRDLACVKGRVSKVIGIDVDPVGAENPALDEFRSLVPGSPWPLQNRSCNLIICDWVMEHLPEPSSFFAEASRVLVPGGYICIRTLNRNSYVGTASRFIPNRYHGRILETAQRDRKAEDIFETHYRCNTLTALRQQMKSHGFRGVVYGHEAEPSYLMFMKLAYFFGVLHQRFAPGFMKTAIFGFGQLQA